MSLKLQQINLKLDEESLEKNLNPWTQLALKVKDYKTKYTENEIMFTVRDLILKDEFEYLSYRGSLTTPGCSENVLWIVSTYPIPISQFHLMNLRKMKNANGQILRRNYRPVQYSTQERIVTYYS